MTNDLREKFPDGTPIDEWFYHAEIPTLSSLGKQYLATDYNGYDSVQNLITNNLKVEKI